MPAAATATLAASPLLPYWKRNPGAKLRLFAFHWAGSSASSYTAWARDLPEEVELCAVQLPGREGRTGEPMIKTCQDAAAAVVAGLAPLFQDLPFVLFGHSKGSWTAFEVARALRKGGYPLPKAMFVSGFPAPQTPVPARPWRANAELGEDDFKGELQAWGVKPIVLSTNIFNDFHDVFRSDFGMFDAYHYEEEPPLEGVRIVALLGQDDPRVTKGLMEGWSLQTNRPGDFKILEFSGGHFYLQDAPTRAPLVAAVGKDLHDLISLMDDVDDLF